MILALNQGVDSRGVRLVPAHLIDAMLDGETSQYGFGLQFRGTPNTNALEANDNSFRHTGSHGNRTRTVMCGNPHRNEGIVVFTNRGKDTDGEDEVIDGILRKYTRTRQWPTTCH